MVTRALTGLASIVCCACLFGCAEPRTFDVLITGGTVVDGTGAPSFNGDVGIAGDRIAAVGELGSVRATTVIDATGLIVAPGFIDIHSHADRALVTEAYRDGEPLLRQGVTTVMSGIDGAYSARQIRDLSERLLDPGVPVNFAFYVGHNGVRSEVVGSAPRHATNEELDAMRGIVREAMEEGAYGLSTGLMYLPGRHASSEEVIELAKVVAEFGGVYDSHVRDPANDLLASVEECIRIGREAGIPAHPAHLKAVGGKNFGKGPELVAVIQGARDRGESVTADQYPYDGAATRALPAIMVPPPGSPIWEDVRLLEDDTTPPDQRAEAFARAVTATQQDLRDPVEREVYRRMAEDPPAEVFSWIDSVGYTSFRIVVSGHPGYEGELITAIAAAEGRHPFDVIADLVVEEGAGAVITLGAILEEDVRVVMRQSWTMIASDGELGGDHPRGHGTFARVLGRYVREWNVLTLEDAIRKMTTLPAVFLGLDDRGRLAPGRVADVTVFDPETIIDRSSWSDPAAVAVGVDQVLVNGVVVLRDGAITGATSGRRLRKSQGVSGS